MSLLKKSVLFFVCIVALGNAQDIETFDIEVEVKNIENDEGKMFFGLHDNENDFLKKEIKGGIKDIRNRTSTITFKDVPVGIYAVSVFHDENDNGKLDTNSFGIPIEAFGCSNNAKGFMGPPKWKNAKFELRGKDQILFIKL